jgi:hypothetical protein
MAVAQETVVLSGHIIDSLILAKVLDTILTMDGTFDLEEVSIGKTRHERSTARIVVRAGSAKLLSEILRAIQPHGASVQGETDCQHRAAPADGVFPEDFYATTHLPTQVRLAGQWIDVEGMEMDLGIVVDRETSCARAVPMAGVSRGDAVVVGRSGIRRASSRPYYCRCGETHAAATRRSSSPQGRLQGVGSRRAGDHPCGRTRGLDLVD